MFTCFRAPLLGTQTTVVRHLRAMAARGKVEQCVNGSWGLKAAEVQAHLFTVPVFGTIPATRAAQMDPVDSLKYE